MKNGFTLLEILVAILILAIGILVVSELTIMGMRTSTIINRQMYARDVLGRRYEILQALPTSDPLLRHRTSTNLNDTIPGRCDFTQIENTPAGAYRVVWNIADNSPDNRFKTVRIHVLWRGARRPLQSDLIKRY